MSKGRELACALHFQLEGAVRLVSALGGVILVTRLAGEVDVSLRSLFSENPNCSTDQFRNSKPSNNQDMQFRCVALSGKTNHSAFTHQSMLTGVVETGVALNVALPGQPFLVVPVREAESSKASGVFGVLCVGGKTDAKVQQFTPNDEALATTAAMMIATMLMRCPASRFVSPYPVKGLAHLGLQTLIPSDGLAEVRAMPEYSTTPLVYRTSSRSILSGSHISSLEPQSIPSLQDLHDIVLMNNLTQNMLEQEQQRTNHLVNTNTQLERRLRSVQQDVRQAQATVVHSKSEEDCFRLAAQLAQQALEERIVFDETRSRLPASNQGRHCRLPKRPNLQPADKPQSVRQRPAM